MLFTLVMANKNDTEKTVNKEQFTVLESVGCRCVNCK